MSQQKTACRYRKWEECNKSAVTKEAKVMTKVVNKMSTQGRICHDQEAHVATKETRRQ